MTACNHARMAGWCVTQPPVCVTAPPCSSATCASPRPTAQPGPRPAAGCALLAAGVAADQLYHDLASGKRDDRPGLAACLKALRQGDVLVAWKLDRLGRDLRHLVNMVHELTSRGVGLRILTGQGASIDTTTAAGKLVFGIFAALAEFERELIIERTKAGLLAARARGRQGGRPYKMTPAKLRLARGRHGPTRRPRSPTSAASSASPGRRYTATSAPKGPCAPMEKSCLLATRRSPAQHNAEVTCKPPISATGMSTAKCPVLLVRARCRASQEFARHRCVPWIG